ncbi:MAG: TolC family protein [Planctomycetes bacterium]|nr:TolC family protein [Planctomycetota bacterium]
MTIFARFFVRGRAPALGVTIAALLAAGCQSNAPQPTAEESIALAIGTKDAVVFRDEGGPLDEPSHTGALSASDALRLAVTTDPSLQAALARVRVAMADADQARLLPNPVLTIAYMWGPGLPQVQVSLMEELIQCLQIPRKASAADNRLARAAADAVTVALDVVVELQSRYAAVQAGDQLIPLLEDRLSLLNKLAQVARNRLDAGEGVRSDVTTLSAQRVALEVEIADARLKRREDRLRLARLIGEPSSAGEWKLDSWSAPALEAHAESQWVNAALLHRPEVQAVTWQLAALGDEYALANLAPWESLSVGAQTQRDDQSFFTGPALSTPIPIFDTGSAKRARAEAEQMEARHNLTLARRKVVEEVRVAYQALAGNLANLRRVQMELVPLQQQRRQEAEDAYQAGQTDVTTVFLAEQDLETSLAKSVDIELQAILSLMRLQRAVGGPGVTPVVAPVETANAGANS